MGIIERTGDRLHDAAHLAYWHSVGVTLLQHCADISSVDVVHQDPQSTLVLAAAMRRDDVAMTQRRYQLSFAMETLTKLRVGGNLR